jgi:hypothetical protein
MPGAFLGFLGSLGSYESAAGKAGTIPVGMPVLCIRFIEFWDINSEYGGVTS